MLTQFIGNIKKMINFAKKLFHPKKFWNRITGKEAARLVNAIHSKNLEIRLYESRTSAMLEHLMLLYPLTESDREEMRKLVIMGNFHAYIAEGIAKGKIIRNAEKLYTDEQIKEFQDRPSCASPWVYPLRDYEMKSMVPHFDSNPTFSLITKR